MNTPGIPSTRWFDATLLTKDDVAQKDNSRPCSSWATAATP